jgi:hypothetical protein
MRLDNLPSEIYSHIFEYFSKKGDRQELFTLMLVCKAFYLPAMQLYYANVNLIDNHQSFLSFLKTHQGGISPRFIKYLRVSNYEDPEEELLSKEDFSFMIQSLPNLDTIEFKAENTNWYLDVMVNHIQLEHLKQLTCVNILYSHASETIDLHLALMYKICDTITFLQVQDFRNIEPIPFIRKFVKLTHLDTGRSFTEGVDLFTILEACPNLQDLTILSTPVSLPTKKPVVHQNLKDLKIEFSQFPEQYAIYMTSCIPTTINSLSIRIKDDDDWIFTSENLAWIDQFSTFLSNPKKLNLVLSRMVQERTDEQIEAMLTRILRFTNIICGKHCQSSMITNAVIQLIPTGGFDDEQRCEFIVHRNKYVYFSVPLYGAFNNSLCLQDIRVENKAYFTMIHSLSIHDDMLPGRDTDSLLQFMQYMVKRCSRLDRLFVALDPFLNNVVFAPAALTEVWDDSLPLNYVTTPTEDNILYASYSDMVLSNRFLRTTLQMFPNIETVKLHRCNFEGLNITIDLSCLLHLRRLDICLKQIYTSSKVLFVVNMDNNAPLNYYFEKPTKNIPFTLVLKNSDVQEEEDCAVIKIICFKIDEIMMQWSYTDMPSFKAYPQSDLLDTIHH